MGIENVWRPVLIAVGREEGRPIIGDKTLELPGLKVSPITGKLKKIRHRILIRETTRAIKGLG